MLLIQLDNFKTLPRQRVREEQVREKLGNVAQLVRFQAVNDRILRGKRMIKGILHHQTQQHSVEQQYAAPLPATNNCAPMYMLSNLKFLGDITQTLTDQPEVAQVSFLLQRSTPNQHRNSTYTTHT